MSDEEKKEKKESDESKALRKRREGLIAGATERVRELRTPGDARLFLRITPTAFEVVREIRADGKLVETFRMTREDFLKATPAMLRGSAPVKIEGIGR